MTIGERLEEARKRKGISIREVAEATKIRSDYLLAMEDNSMDIPLPEIYKRGFLLNYAKFLRLDSSTLLTDYEAQQRGRSAAASRERGGGHHEDRSLFGSMELPGEDDDEPPSSEDGEESSGKRKAPPPRPMPILTDNTIYIKIAVGFAGLVLVVLLVWVLVSLLRSDEPSYADTTTPADVAEQSAPAAAAANTPPASPSSITIVAEDAVTVIVDSVRTRERLFSGMLQAGDQQLIEKDGPVIIKYSSGEAIAIQRPGLPTLRPPEPTLGQVRVD